ncbi:uncharacterized protein A4U43_C05F30640 [Asparagus officinalis]|uniref:Uncharacterized protein n=1 Tax=Asparagus officinalis TaxID=4686 RepID=A0A5P1EY65_ASPOF|nr:uncharacterized protein A4U43_C05F30640 [Asparagus officinalis]
MQIIPFLSDRSILRRDRDPQIRAHRRPVERVRAQRSDGTQHELGEIEDARRQNLHLPASSADPVSIWTTCLKDWVSAWMKVVGYGLGLGFGFGFDLGVRGGRDADG